LQTAIRARQAYLRKRNKAGALRADFERVYALRRLSRPKKCLDLAPQLEGAASKLQYRWIEIQTIIEQGSCEGMRGRSDTSWDLAGKAIDKASTANYQILYLRALGLRGNLDMIEGRSDASWITNENALKLFWENAFPNERGFQLYYNLQVDAEKNNAIYLALTLQKETLSMIAGRSRFDFEALAHFRMAGAAQAAGDLGTANKEIELYKVLISQIADPTARALFEAYSDVGLARLAMQSRRSEDAQKHLDRAAPIASLTNNSALRLEFLKTQADVDFLTHNVRDEQERLTEIMSIANEGFSSLKSVTDRWRWRRVVEGVYRRLLEIEMSSPHSSAHALGYLEFYRQQESAASPPVVDQHELSSVEKRINDRAGRLHNTTLVSFGVLPSSAVVWVADDRGIREFKLTVSPNELRKEVQEFYFLCSDPKSSIEKVNASGSRLYQWLIAPIESALAKDRSILVEPDGVLGLAPWAALRTPAGEYLGRNRAIAINPGLFASGVASAKETIAKKVTIAIPDSLHMNGANFQRLPNADEEAAELGRLYPKTRVIRGTSVTVANIVDEISRADIFEFAGHAVTREHGGELVVQGIDGAEIVSANSLANLHLRRKPLVVLSACSTGTGSDAGRDPNGLVRALLNAGAGRVMATRWDVDSRATAAATRLFYRALKSGMTKAEALRAVRGKSAKGEFGHPYYWAGIELFSAN
jgi:CHAT domain-containing protein